MPDPVDQFRAALAGCGILREGGQKERLPTFARAFQKWLEAIL